MDERGLVERVDSLTAAVADLAFKLDTLISSTAAFRESFGERMTDYADLVAQWSIETEQNLATQRRTVDQALAAHAEAMAKSERRTLEALEGVETRLADALAAVLAEVATVPRERIDLAPVTDELRHLREVLAEADVDDVEDEVSFAAALGQQLAALRDDVKGLADGRRARAKAGDDETAAALAALRAQVETLTTHGLPEAFNAVRAEVKALRPKGKAGDEVTEELAGLRAEVRALSARGFDGELADAVHALRADVADLQQRVATAPPVPPEVTALTDALRSLRTELENEPAEVTTDDRLEETLAELVYEVRALRRRFPVPATSEEGEAPAAPAAPRRRRRPAD